MASLEHPDSIFHLGATDGFCLSAEREMAEAKYFTDDGLLAPTYPNATSVQHRTADNKFIVTETFAQNTATKTVTVTMKVQNVSGFSQILALARIADFDAGSSPSENSWVQTARTVQATRPGRTTAVLAGATISVPMATMTVPFDEPMNTLLGYACYNAPGDDAIGPVAGHQVAVVQYDFGSVNNGATKTVKFTYQIIF